MIYRALTFILLVTTSAAFAGWSSESYRLESPEAAAITKKLANKHLLLNSMSLNAAVKIDLAQVHPFYVGNGDIVRAELSGLSDIYPHGALGDEREPRNLRVTDRSGSAYLLSLSQGQVFEDNRLRLTDLNGDGLLELLLVRSQPELGAGLVLYGLVDGALTEVAASQPIGTGFRWMNPVGAGDVDGDGVGEIVSVRIPHIGGILELYRRQGDQLVLEQRLSGVSNHRYGSPEQRLSLLADMDGDGLEEVVVPDATMASLLHIDWSAEGWKIRHRLPLSAPLRGPLLSTDIDDDGRPELIFADDQWLRVWRYKTQIGVADNQ